MLPRPGFAAAALAIGLLAAGLAPLVGAAEQHPFGADGELDTQAFRELAETPTLRGPALSHGGAGPDSSLLPAQNRKAPPSACTATITETLTPGTPTLCESAQVTVELGVTCPVSLPLHVVLVVGHHLAMQDHLDDVKRAARELIDDLDFSTGVKVGLVGISGEARTIQELTDSKTDALSAINRLRLDPVNPFVQYFDWVGRAQDMLERERSGTSPQEVIVVYSTGCPNGFDNYCTRQVASASKAQGAGMTVIGVCHPNARPFGLPLPNGHCRTLQQMASAGRYHDLSQVSRASQDLADLRVTAAGLGAASLQLREALAAEWRVAPDSAEPVPAADNGDMVFTWNGLASGQVVSATYRVSATGTGVFPLRRLESAVALVDTLGRGWEAALPTRPVTVTECAVPTSTPSVTPEPPTPTDTREPTDPPVTHTATPRPATATPAAQSAYLPIAMQRVCLEAVAPVDVVLLIDTSSSMAGADAGVTKFEAAKRAARTFVDLLDLGRDRAAVVGFDAQAPAAQPLSASAADLVAAIDGLSLGAGTRLDRALEASLPLLGDADPQRTRVVILLTDGRPDPGTEAAARVSASELTRVGIRLFAVGLGTDVDAELLAAMAGDGFVAASAESLEAVYEDIAVTLPCPDGQLWRRRVAQQTELRGAQR